MINKLIQKLFGKHSEEGSKDIAKKRLKLALVCDKLEVSEDILKKLQTDIVAVISRYFEIDSKEFNIDIQKTDDLASLVLNTPILRTRAGC
jgi:cell division topological specificity factor